jgi:hypothetical protein
LKAAPDQEEARVRLRTALRRVINNVYCLFTGRGVVRMAAVEVHFTDEQKPAQPSGRRRCYLIFHEPPRGRRGMVSRPGRTWWLALDGPWNKESGQANSLKDRGTALRVLGKLDAFDIPPYEDIRDSAGHAGVRAGLAGDPAALLAMLERDEHDLPAYAAARVRAVARACVQLGWPVFTG